MTQRVITAAEGWTHLCHGPGLITLRVDAGLGSINFGPTKPKASAPLKPGETVRAGYSAGVTLQPGTNVYVHTIGGMTITFDSSNVETYTTVQASSGEVTAMGAGVDPKTVYVP